MGPKPFASSRTHDQGGGGDPNPVAHIKEREKGGWWPAGDGHGNAGVRPGHDRGPGGKHEKEREGAGRRREKEGAPATMAVSRRSGTVVDVGKSGAVRLSRHHSKRRREFEREKGSGS